MQEGAHPRGVITGIWIAAALTAAVVVLAGRITKGLFLSYGTAHHATIIPNVLEIIHHENYGIVANVPLPLPLIIAVTVMVMALIVVGILKSARTNELIRAITLAEIFGGALGNLIDRITQGFVFDWILLFGQSAINIADIAVIEGAIVYVGWAWFEKKRLAVSD